MRIFPAAARIPQQQLVEEEIYQRSMARITQTFLVEVLDLICESLAHVPKPPEVVKASSPSPVDINRLQQFHGRNRLHGTPSSMTSQSFRYSLTTPSGDQLKT
jgi:hypothetical protein